MAGAFGTFGFTFAAPASTLAPGTHCKTLRDIWTHCLERSDEPTDTQYFTDAEAVWLVRGSISDLWDLIIANQGQEWMQAKTTVTRVEGKTLYTPLDGYPSDLYKVLSIHLEDDRRSICKPWMIREESFNQDNSFWGIRTDRVPRYHTFYSPVVSIGAPGNGCTTKGLEWDRAPSHNFTIRYIPHAPAFISLDDQIEVFSDWDEYVIVDVAMKIREKKDLPTDHLQRRKDAQVNRIVQAASNLDSGHPMRVVDIYNRFRR